MKAYDIEISSRPVDRRKADNHGWCFGLPPGISPRQWPLDPVSGYPLMHGFTLLLPEEYRVHGPDIVAMSFFATSFDQNDGGANEDPVLVEAVLAESAIPPDDPERAVFWHMGRARHPRLARMTDILDYAYAVIPLTRAEFDGPLCEPPRMANNRFLQQSTRPAWLDTGSAAAYWEMNPPRGGKSPEEHWLYEKIGEIPDRTLSFHRALRWTPRMDDPNAGRIPRENHSWAAEKTDYLSPLYVGEDGKYQWQSWTKDHKPNHIGGTMRPSQNIPEFSPFYVEFEEYFGGYNFGGGNAQLDFRDMKFDWACG